MQPLRLDSRLAPPNVLPPLVPPPIQNVAERLGVRWRVARFYLADRGRTSTLPGGRKPSDPSLLSQQAPSHGRAANANGSDDMSCASFPQPQPEHEPEPDLPPEPEVDAEHCEVKADDPKTEEDPINSSPATPCLPEDTSTKSRRRSRSRSRGRKNPRISRARLKSRSLPVPQMLSPPPMTLRLMKAPLHPLLHLLALLHRSSYPRSRFILPCSRRSVYSHLLNPV